MSTHSNPQNPYTQSQPEKKKAGRGKKILLGGVGVLVVLGVVGACSPTDNDTTPTTTETQVSTQVESPANESSVAPEQAEEQQIEEEAAPLVEDVPREYENALKKAESYLNFSAFSYQGLYDQLTSEYGSGFTPEAAQYAVDNVEVDWNEQAVKKAESYLEFSAFSEQGLYEQLTSEYGSGFTPEQAQYAISVVY